MSKLQSDFTTPEQSKRLLELGVPEDSADLVIESGCDVKKTIPSWTVFTKWCQNRRDYSVDYEKFMPCWSVGRLMKIFSICFDPDFIHFDTYADGINFLQQMMDKFETYAENMDFSKLEE